MIKVHFEKPIRDYNLSRFERRMVEEARKRAIIKRILTFYCELFNPTDPTSVLVYQLIRVRERYIRIRQEPVRTKHTLAEIFIMAGCPLP